MQAGEDAVCGQAAGAIDLESIRAQRRHGEGSFFPWLSASIVAFVFIGFARTYFLANLFGVPPPKPLFVFHGALMSGWVVLGLVTQPS
jgi:hypothetical protein